MASPDAAPSFDQLKDKWEGPAKSGSALPNRHLAQFGIDIFEARRAKEEHPPNEWDEFLFGGDGEKNFVIVAKDDRMTPKIVRFETIRGERVFSLGLYRRTIKGRLRWVPKAFEQHIDGGPKTPIRLDVSTRSALITRYWGAVSNNP